MREWCEKRLMPRCVWKNFAGRRLPTFVYIYIFLFILLFLCLLPYLCSSWVYSWYFRTKFYEKSAESILKERDDVRHAAAITYLQQIEPKESKKWHKNRITSKDLDILVIVKTIDRSVINTNPPTSYLTQTSTELDRQIRQTTDLKLALVICNVERFPNLYKEAKELEKYYLSVIKYENWTDDAGILLKREREKRDYVFCLDQSLNFAARYILMVEDDTQPYNNVFNRVWEVVENRLERKFVREESERASEWLFLKLYYPERWAGYGMELPHVSELVGFGLICGWVCLLIGGFVTPQLRWIHLMLGFVFGLLLLLSLGRQHVMQLRRWSWRGLLVSRAPGCCTPAVLFPAKRVRQVVAYLRAAECTEAHGVDLALDDFAGNVSLDTYLVQPNLFHHRGLYSTLTKPKNKVEFLFDP